MSVELIVSRHFQKEAKRLLKKYPSLKKELERLHAELEVNPTAGTPLGESCYTNCHKIDHNFIGSRSAPPSAHCGDLAALLMQRV